MEGMRIVVDEDGASEEFAGAHDVFFALEGVVKHGRGDGDVELRAKKRELVGDIGMTKEKMEVVGAEKQVGDFKFFGSTEVLEKHGVDVSELETCQLDEVGMMGAEVVVNVGESLTSVG